MKKVSIIVPVYNTEKYLPALFDSLLSQTFENIEVVAVDDGSTDSSADICRRYAEKDSRISVYSIENIGVSGARNFGLDKAAGDYVMFLDSDDSYTPDAVEKLVTSAEETDSDIVSAGIVKIDPVGEHKIICTAYKGEVEGDELYSLLKEAFLGRDAGLCSFIDKLYRLDFIKERGIRFPALKSGEDTVFALEAMICASKIYFLEGHCFYRYVINEGSFTKQKFSIEKRIAFSNMFFAECEKLIDKYGMAYLKDSFDGRRALAIYDFVMNTVSREDLDKTQKLEALSRICLEKYYTDITDKEILKTHSFRVKKTANLAAKGNIKKLYSFASLLNSVKRLKQKIKG